MIISVTGHRPHRLGGYNSLVYDNLFKLAYSKLESLCPERVYTGMALGWDIAVARAANELKIDYIAVVPFPSQYFRWSCEDIELYRNLYDCAYDRIVLYEKKPKDIKLINSSYIERDYYMVDNCDMLLALYDGEEGGGTYQTIKYAEKTNKPIVNLWDEYQKMMA